MTQALLASCALPSALPFSFTSVPSLSAFVSFSVSRKVLIAYCFSCAVFKVRIEVSFRISLLVSCPILQNDTEFFQKNIRFLFVSLSLTRMCFAFALSPSACCTLFFSYFLHSLVPLPFPSASLAHARPRNLKHFTVSCLPRKEVIQPHLPIRLPCYDFTPVIGLTFGGCSLR